MTIFCKVDRDLTGEDFTDGESLQRWNRSAQKNMNVNDIKEKVPLFISIKCRIWAPPEARVQGRESSLSWSNHGKERMRGNQKNEYGS